MYFDRVQDKLKDLENIKLELLPNVINHLDKNEEEEEEEAREIIYEFKKESLDPFRQIAKWEKHMKIKRRGKN